MSYLIKSKEGKIVEIPRFSEERINRTIFNQLINKSIQNRKVTTSVS